MSRWTLLQVTEAGYFPSAEFEADGLDSAAKKAISGIDQAGKFALVRSDCFNDFVVTLAAKYEGGVIPK